ncbi:MAG: hypothetical protein EOP09_15370, partial [Proteobacteria bacterium]
MMNVKRNVAVIFVNPIEFHGRHMPLKTDHEISQALFARIKLDPQVQKLGLQFQEIETIHRGCDPARGQGSERTSVAELTALLISASKKALEIKPLMVVFMTFHGSPTHAYAIAQAETWVKSHGVMAYNPFNLALEKLRDYDPSWALPLGEHVSDPVIREKWVARLPSDFHGGLFETSVLLALNASVVKASELASLPDCPERRPGLVAEFFIRFF